MLPRMLVVAKAPVAGSAKTRLAVDVGDRAAAEAAAAALLDTLAAARDAVGAGRCVLALTGDLAEAAAGDEITAALAGWTVVAQRGDGFADRLAQAHADAGPGPVVQVGMDTPQVGADLLGAVAAGLRATDAVLGAAADGGWWVLALRDPRDAVALRGVAMSTPTTYADTAAALRSRGLTIGPTDTVRDVDTLADADAVAALAPDTRFARSWTGLRAGVR